MSGGYSSYCYISYSLLSANRGRAGPGATVVLLALMCIVALMLPTQGEKGSRLPDYLHLTVNQKLIAAYVLGKVGML